MFRGVFSRIVEFAFLADFLNVDADPFIVEACGLGFV